MSFKVMSRPVAVINTDPQRRCYDGVNFSERIEYGPWTLFQEHATKEIADRVARIFTCGRYEYKVEPSTTAPN